MKRYSNKTHAELQRPNRSLHYGEVFASASTSYWDGNAWILTDF